MLAGGSLFKALAPLARAPGVAWGRWHVFFVDERNVPHSSPDSNFKGADEALLSKVRQCICQAPGPAAVDLYSLAQRRCWLAKCVAAWSGAS